MLLSVQRHLYHTQPPPLLPLSSLALSHFQTVKLVLQNDIILSKGQNLTFGPDFSCTILTSAENRQKPTGYTITYSSDNAAALAIIGASNVIALRVGFRSQAGPSSAPCALTDEFAFSAICPTVLVLKSYGVQIGKVREGGGAWQGEGGGAEGGELQGCVLCAVLCR